MHDGSQTVSQPLHGKISVRCQPILFAPQMVKRFFTAAPANHKYLSIIRMLGTVLLSTVRDADGFRRADGHVA